MSVSIGTLCLELAACAQTAQANVVGAAQPVELSLARRTKDTKTHFALKVRKRERVRKRETLRGRMRVRVRVRQCVYQGDLFARTDGCSELGSLLHQCVWLRLGSKSQCIGWRALAR